MKVEVIIGETTYPATVPHEGAEYVRVVVACPACGETEAELGIRVQGGERTHGHDTITAPARHLDCGAVIGRIVVTVSTIFGLEEDHAVLHGRARVY